MKFILKLIFLVLLTITTNALQATPLLDSIIFGNTESEKTHNFSVEHSELISGGLGETARILSPLSPPTYHGESMSFELKVDKQLQTYFTIRLWGNDMNENLLVLYIERKQVGYLHIGDIDILDHGSNAEDLGQFRNRFQYVTSPLPIGVTKDKTSVHLEIRPFGRINPYASTFPEFQHNMTEQTRGVYRAYTHTDGFFEPSSLEKQGSAPTLLVREHPGIEIMDKVKTRVNNTVKELLDSKTPISQMHSQFLAKAYHVNWTPAYNNAKAVERVITSIDHIYTRYVNDTKFVEWATDTWNADWFGVGPCGDAIWTLAEQIKPNLTQLIDDGKGKKVERSLAWIDMLKASRDYHLKNRRQYTNQGMIVDLYIYLANKGIEHINSSFALPEQKTLALLYEAVGITPWLGSQNNAGEFINPFNSSFYQLTEKGLTRELGYVGWYGEVLDWVTMIYDATRPKYGEPGDEKIRKQLEKIIKARAAFRYQALDNDGYKAMFMETIVGWRDVHYPGGVVYAQRNAWDGTPIQAVSRTLDKVTVGYAQQMIRDNQLFKSIDDKLSTSHETKINPFRVVSTLLSLPEDYDAIISRQNTGTSFPMLESDFLFSDEEDGVVAVKHNNTILYASLYWRSRYAINNLARVHYITPTVDRIAVVYLKTNFTDSGKTYSRADWIDFGFDITQIDFPYVIKYPDDLHSANAGEILAVPQLAVDMGVHIGDESIYAGRADFYELSYGPFLIGMNTHRTKSYDLVIPNGVTSATDLVSKTEVQLSATFSVKPFSTQVFYINS